MKKYSFLVLLLFVVLGCDSVRNPFNAISEETAKVGEVIEVNISLPYQDNIVYPGRDASALQAPAAAGKISAESNLFAEADYPASKVLTFNTVQELNTTRIKVHTAVPGWIRIWFIDGGTIYNICINGTLLSNIDKNGAFQLMFDLDGRVIQLETEIQLVDVKFVLTTNESSATTIYFSSDVTGWAGIPMEYKGSKTWEYGGRYIPDKDFTFVAWSNVRARYIYTIKVNGTEAVYLIKIDQGSKTAYPVYHFEGYLDKNGKFLNSGADNRQITVGQLDP